MSLESRTAVHGEDVADIGSGRHATLDERFGQAVARAESGYLVVATGAVEQRWRVTTRGLQTTALVDTASGRNWVAAVDEDGCDWDLTGLTDGPVCLRGLRAGPSDNDGFTTPHLEVVVALGYPACGVEAEFVLWLYPGAPGIRSCLRFQGTEAVTLAAADEGRDRVFAIGMDLAALRRTAVSFSKHNTARAERYDEHPMMREIVRSGHIADDESHPHAAFMTFADARSGLAVIKEAPVIDSPVRGTKWETGRTNSYRTGAFTCSSERLEVTGGGIAPTDLAKSRFRPGWALWTVVHGAGELALQRALKAFDRARYPVDVEQDLLVVANNWGSTETAGEGWKTSTEASILQEIDVAGDIGIDLVQVDDGWQANRWHDGGESPEEQWRLGRTAYPSGWATIKAKAQERGVSLGLWCDGDDIPIETLLDHVRSGGFRHVKFDFYRTDTYELIELLRNSAKRLHTDIGHPVRVNWDVTGIDSKQQGCFYGREYGNLWYQNQKQHLPDHVLYRPYRVLRDFWLLSHYVNANQLQVPVQNVDAVYATGTNAGDHSHGYAFAIALMGAPVFFQELKYLSTEAQRKIGDLLSLYKGIRSELAEGFVYPIGDEPNDGSWTGFQCHRDATDDGFLLVFREMGNAQGECRLPLHFCANKSLCLRDLLDQEGERRTVRVPADGRVEFKIEHPGGWRLLRYNLG